MICRIFQDRDDEPYFDHVWLNPFIESFGVGFFLSGIVVLIRYILAPKSIGLQGVVFTQSHGYLWLALVACYSAMEVLHQLGFIKKPWLIVPAAFCAVVMFCDVRIVDWHVDLHTYLSHWLWTTLFAEGNGSDFDPFISIGTEGLYFAWCVLKSIALYESALLMIWTLKRVKMSALAARQKRGPHESYPLLPAAAIMFVGGEDEGSAFVETLVELFERESQFNLVVARQHFAWNVIRDLLQLSFLHAERTMAKGTVNGRIAALDPRWSDMPPVVLRMLRVAGKFRRER